MGCTCQPLLTWASAVPPYSVQAHSSASSQSSAASPPSSFLLSIRIKPSLPSSYYSCEPSFKPVKSLIRTIPANPSPFYLRSLPLLLDNGSYGGSNNNNNNNNGYSNNDSNDWHEGDDGSSRSDKPLVLFSLLFCSMVCCFCHFQMASALARTGNGSPEKSESESESETGFAWEVKGGKWTMLIPHPFKDAFVAAPGTGPSIVSPSFWSFSNLWLQSRDVMVRLLLPEGFPESVSSDYLNYSLWRGVQGVASQISGVLATQALLYAVGLGKGAIPTAAAVNWVLKDGIGYLSKIMLSKYGRHFDVNPKGWRLFADLLENAAFGLEMLTPAFPHLFVPIGAAAGAGRSAAALIQAATRSCFCAGFAAQRNFAEVIAKGEAQGMVSKSVGIVLGIALANSIGSSISLAVTSFSVVTCIHMFCNLKSYQSIQLRTLNPYRASLVFSEYLLSGQAPPIKEVNDEEPLFPAAPLLNMKPLNKGQPVVLSSEAKDAAAEIEDRLQLGAKLSEAVNSKEDVLALFYLYRNEGYLLTEQKGKFIVVLKETCSQQDMLKALFHVNYLFWLEKNAGIEARSALDDCKPGGRLQLSLEYVQREFNHVKIDSESVGWVMDGLIARPLPTRIRPGYVDSSVPC